MLLNLDSRKLLLMNISKHHRLDQVITHLILSDVLTVDLKHQHIPFGGSSHHNSQNYYTGMPGPVYQ